MKHRNLPCSIYCGSHLIKSFPSKSAAAEHILKQHLDTHTKTTIVRKITNALNNSGEYLGWIWKYDNYSECPEQVNIIKHTNPITSRVNIVETKILVDNNEKIVDEYIQQENTTIRQQRKDAFEQSLGVKSILAYTMPQKLTKYDVMKDIEIEMPEEYNLLIETDSGLLGCDDLIMALQLTKTNLTKEIAAAIWEDDFAPIHISQKFRTEFQEILKKFLN